MKKILLSASFLLITGYMFATDLISGQTYRLSLGEKVLSVKDGSLANNSDVVSWTETECECSAMGTCVRRRERLSMDECIYWSIPCL